MTRKRAASKPEPVPMSVVCSLCGELWASHQADADGEVSTLECIRILKAKGPTIIYRNWPYQWTYTYVSPPMYSATNYQSNITTANTDTLTYRTPAVAKAQPAA